MTPAGQRRPGVGPLWGTALRTRTHRTAAAGGPGARGDALRSVGKGRGPDGELREDGKCEADEGAAR